MPIPAALTAAIPSILGAGGSIFGDLLGASSQRSANRANLQIARENRAWQERMSNSAYQRAAFDLDAAGLNRILALGSPATTPGGNTAKMEAPFKSDMGSRAVGASVSAFTASQTAKKMKAERDLLAAQTEETGAKTRKLDQETIHIGEQIGLTRKQTERVAAEIGLIEANETLAKETAKKIVEEARGAATAADKARWELGLQQALYDGKVGQVLYFIKQMAVPIAALGLGGLMRGKGKAPRPDYKPYKPGPSGIKNWRSRIPENN